MRPTPCRPPPQFCASCCASQKVQRMLSVGILNCGVSCLPEQAIRDDLTVRTRKGNRTLEDLVCEIDQLSKIGLHPNVVGFVGAIIDETNFTEPIIVLEYVDGGCLQDVLATKSKNGGSWRPPKETSFSWYAPTPMQWILCACSGPNLAVVLRHDRARLTQPRRAQVCAALCRAQFPSRP